MNSVTLPQARFGESSKVDRKLFFEEISADVDNLIARAEAFVGLDSADLNRVTSAHDWSLGQLFNHLVKSDINATNRLEQAINASSGATDTDANHTFLAKFILGGMLRPNIPVPPAFAPEKRQYDRAVVEQYVANLRKVKAMLPRAMKADLAKIRVQSDGGKFIIWNGFDVLMIVCKHGNRHLNQAEAVHRVLLGTKV